jgi:ligand-binding sensor domain-containing protein/DNA-binding NarL/FixJ family response regulator
MAFSGIYPIQNFAPSEYKAGIQNIDFAQNRDMTLFVANNLGVLSYNGKDWIGHAFNTGKKLRSLVFDETSNRLYFGSQGEFGYFEGDWKQVSLLNKIPSLSPSFDEVWDVFLHNSKVYFCTFQGVYIYNGQSVSVISQKDGFYRTFLAAGKLFTQSRKGRLFEIKDLELLAPPFMQNEDNGTVAGIIQHDQGHLLVYNSGRIELATPFGVSQKYNDLSKALQGKYVNHVLQLSDTRLVICTQTSGLFLYDLKRQTLETITTSDGLRSNACLRAFQDFSGKLWVGMQNGIALIDINSPMRFINQKINLQGSGYEAYKTDHGTYFTTSNGIYFLGNDASRCQYLEGTEGPAYSIQKITFKLYAGHHTGLFLLENGKAKRVANTHGMWQVKQLLSNPEFAIGGTYSGLYLFRLMPNLELRPVQQISGFDESSRFFEEDQKGRIWVGQFYKGLYQLELSEDMTIVVNTKVMNSSFLPINDQIILSRIDNELFLATSKGVFKIDPMRDSIVKADVFSKDIGTQQVYLLAQDNQKNIHVYTDNMVGFFKQISPNNYTFVPSSLYQLRYSFNNDLLNVSINTTDGVLFNANEGFIQYRPEFESRLVVEKPMIIRKVVSVAEDSVLYALNPFETVMDKMWQLLVTSKAKVLKFDVEAFQFNEVNNQQFRYYLKGFDEDYGEWTNSSAKEYTNLTEGEYEFYVQTKNFLGQIITSKPMSIKVLPPFYRSLLAKLIYAAFGFIALGFAYKYQKMHYRRKELALEASRKEELARKQQELTEMETQKEQKLRQMEEEKMKSELRHITNLLAASTMNLVVKNEFMESIKEELQDVKRKGKSLETRQALEKIVKEIETNLKLQEDWEQFEFHFDQVHGDFLNRLREKFNDLSPNEQKLCALLRLNLHTKDIANLMGISLRGVEIARYRLRKKLDLNQGQNLSKYILEY